MGKEAELLFSVPVGIPCWGLGEHEPLIRDDKGNEPFTVFPVRSSSGSKIRQVGAMD